MAEPLSEVELQKIESQYQIGDRVVYRPEGVIAHIDGYMWTRNIDTMPRIIGYNLDCGIGPIPDYLIAKYDSKR